MSPRSNSPPRFSETRLRPRASTRGRVVVKGRRVCAERLLLNPVNLSCPLPPSQRRRPCVYTARPPRVGACGSWKRVGSRGRVSRGMVDVVVSEGRGRNGEAARPLGIAVDGACGKGEHGSLRCHGKAGGGSVGRWKMVPEDRSVRSCARLRQVWASRPDLSAGLVERGPGVLIFPHPWPTSALTSPAESQGRALMPPLP